MITVDGKYQIKRFMASQVAQIAKAVSFGIGEAAPTLNDKRLQFEIGRAPISSVSYNFLTDKIIFKAKVPENLVGRITEVGLWSDMVNTNAGASAEKILTTFEEDEEWDNTPVFSTAQARIGGDALRQAPGAGATIQNTLSTGGIDLSAYSAADKMVVAYNNLNTNVQSVEIRLQTDPINYYSTTITTPTAGYKFHEVAKGAFSVTGSPSWSAINGISITTISKAGVASQLDFDGIVMADVDTVSQDYVLVSRQIIPSFEIIPGTVNEFEFPLGVTV